MYFKVATGLEVTVGTSTVSLADTMTTTAGKSTRNLLVCLLEDILRITEGSSHVTAMDEVELLAEDPVVVGVIDLEPAVWRDAVVSQRINM